MSLFRALAERALGVAQPLRSQLARAPLAMRGEAIDGAEASVAPVPATPSRATPPPALRDTAAAALRNGIEAPRPATSPDTTPTDAPSPGTIAPAHEVSVMVERHDAPPVSPQDTPALLHAVEPAAAQPRHEAGKPPPKAFDSEADPPPLVTRTAAGPPPLAPPVPRDAAPRSTSRAARHAGPSAATPTEVHVSIGRVDLHALPAPAAAPRTPARARDAGGRSLADYLRGSRHRS